MPPRFIIHDCGTIRETREDTPTRPRKRQRTDSGIDTGGYSDNDCLASAEPVQDDPEFYRGDAAADCLVRVGSTRFKFQGSLLSDISPVFQDMVAKNRQPHIALVLIVDVDEFRALLWALYASPTERAAQHREPDDFDRLLRIVPIARQYRCIALEAWAKEVIMHTVSRNDAFIASCSSATFKTIIEVAIRTRHDALLDAAIAQWTTRLRLGSAPCIPAILTADAHELPRLRGLAYYYHIQTMTAQQTSITERGATQFSTDSRLSNAQVIRLLSGHWSLVSLWERLRRQAPKFSCPSGCSAARGECARMWSGRWAVAAASERVNGMSSASVLALMAAMRDQLVVDVELTRNLPVGCRLAALDAVKAQAQKVEDGLADHFFGWL